MEFRKVFLIRRLLLQDSIGNRYERRVLACLLGTTDTKWKQAVPFNYDAS